jgi:hypothetical protein
LYGFQALFELCGCTAIGQHTRDGFARAEDTQLAAGGLRHVRGAAAMQRQTGAEQSPDTDVG